MTETVNDLSRKIANGADFLLKLLTGNFSPEEWNEITSGHYTFLDSFLGWFSLFTVCPNCNHISLICPRCNTPLSDYEEFVRHGHHCIGVMK